MEEIKNKAKVNKDFAFKKQNYMLFIIGTLIIFSGYLLMVGGAAEDVYGFSEEIFSFRRITLAPIVIFVGFMFNIYAIMKK
jgi:hypothetical protein